MEQREYQTVLFRNVSRLCLYPKGQKEFRWYWVLFKYDWLHGREFPFATGKAGMESGCSLRWHQHHTVQGTSRQVAKLITDNSLNTIDMKGTEHLRKSSRTILTIGQRKMNSSVPSTKQRHVPLTMWWTISLMKYRSRDVAVSVTWRCFQWQYTP